MKSLELIKSVYNTNTGILWGEIKSENKKLIRYLFESKLLIKEKLDRKVVYKPKFPIREFRKIAFIDIKKLSTISMVVKNEKMINTVLHKGIVKDWVGIGWIDKRLAVDNDYQKYPVVLI